MVVGLRGQQTEAPPTALAQRVGTTKQVMNHLLGQLESQRFLKDYDDVPAVYDGLGR
jgi:hypothetical protein